MTDLPPDVVALLRERDDARAEKDWSRADEIRDRIASLGFDVRDTPQGGTATAKPAYTVADPAGIENRLDEPAACEISVHVLYEGVRSDLERFITSFARHCQSTAYEIVVTDAASDEGEWIESMTGERVRVLHLRSDPGWAAARNAALKGSRGEIVAIADLSVEPTGDVLGPVVAAFGDPAVGVAGPWGITSKNLRDFEADPGPAVDAIEGYFLATRRSIALGTLLDEKFRWYRHADIEYSFRIREQGFSAVVTSAPAIRHTHRAWTALGSDPDLRERQSRKNFNRFLDRFRNRTDLLVRL